MSEVILLTPLQNAIADTICAAWRLTRTERPVVVQVQTPYGVGATTAINRALMFHDGIQSGDVRVVRVHAGMLGHTPPRFDLIGDAKLLIAKSHGPTRVCIDLGAATDNCFLDKGEFRKALREGLSEELHNKFINGAWSVSEPLATDEDTE